MHAFALDIGEALALAEDDPVVAIQVIPTMTAVLSTPLAATMVRMSMFVAVTAWSCPAVYWLMDSV